MRNLESHTTRRNLLSGTWATLAAGGLVCLTSDVASAGPWTMPSGTTSTFTYTGGADGNDRFGDPLLVLDDTFAFAPDDFVATQGGMVRDRLRVLVTAAPGLQLDAVGTTMFGDYATLLGGRVDAKARLFATVVGGFFDGLALSEAVTFGGVPAGGVDTLGGSDLFGGTALLVLPDGVTTALLELEAELFAESGGGASAIQLKLADLDLFFAEEVAVIPLPAAVAAAPLAGLIAAGAVRRSRRRN